MNLVIFKKAVENQTSNYLAASLQSLSGEWRPIHIRIIRHVLKKRGFNNV